ncbi:(+)-neomenthol dehydrogenase-like [Syzygium oleosum]|uniref:(+)-neomenthol dehydrogenase-like n=1 Tax=Syzygium oleosum TaxID=219896 RepID=UPI0024BB8D30|nr:(+)-neomenthol dehydrogenase-like [Syzygium oleosum]
MAEASTFLVFCRYAVVTGSNKGIGFEICRQLASTGVTVVLTARDEKRGLQAAGELQKNSSLSGGAVIFHQLDVADPASVASLVGFVATQFGRLDILVNNAGISGHIMDCNALSKAVELAGGDFPLGEEVWKEISTEDYGMAEECVKTNYYGAKSVTEALLPLLHLSDSPRIVNVSSKLGVLEFIPGEWPRQVFSDVENLTEERVDRVLESFLQDFKEGDFGKRGWPTHISAYKVSKAALNAYTRIMAKKLPSFLVNSVCPGFVQTDMTCNTGLSTPAQGAESPVWLALLPQGGPSGLFFDRKQVYSFSSLPNLASRVEE